jgi:hypothetical protein
MDTVEILRQFETGKGEFPREAVEAAVAQREAITPELLRILEDTVDRAPQLAADRDYMAHIFAMFLLAQFRETRAYPLVLRLASLPGDLLDSLCGGFLTEGLGQVLASVCGGNVVFIESLIENEATDGWVRWAGLGSLVTLVGSGQKSRDEVVSYFASLFRCKLIREWSNVWDALVSCSSSIYPEELLDDIKRAFADELVDESLIDFDDVKRELAMGRERVLARLTATPHYQLIEDTAAEMESWPCFDNDRTMTIAGGAVEPTLKSLPDQTAKPDVNPSPFRRTMPKTGRNDPCPCGSGTKYKKCCGA